MTIPGGLHVMYLIGLLCNALGIFLHLMGVATVQWSLAGESPTIYYGLFDMCTGVMCTEYTAEFETTSLRACQAFAIIGIIIGGATLILSIVYACMSMMRKSPTKIIPLVAMITGAVSLLCILITVITWAAGTPMRHDVRQHGYSFAISIVGGIFIATGGVLFFLGVS